MPMPGNINKRPLTYPAALFKRDWFEIVDNVPKDGATINFQLDTAFTAKTENDPQAYYRISRKANMFILQDG